MQAKDQLEKVISENREAFNEAEPRKAVCEGIEDQLELDSSKIIVNSVNWYWKAAVVLLIGAVSFLLVDKYSVDKALPVEATNMEKFQELETFYNSLIANKQERLDASRSPEQASMTLEVEIQELDEIYDDLKMLFLESQPSEQVMERLVHLLRQKLRVIDSQLEIMDREKLPEEMKENIDSSL